MIRKWRKSCLWFIGALLLVLAGTATQSEAEVNVQINLPSIMFAAPPAVVVIPGTYVYMVPDIDVDVLFYQGYWWRPYEGRWYRSQDYQGRYTKSRRIPQGLRALPRDYRHRIMPEHERISHGDVQNNWQRWEKDKRWDGHGKQGKKDRGRHGDRERQGRHE